MDWYLNTKSGFLLYAAGDNQQVVTALAKDQGKVKILGLILANGLVSLDCFAVENRQICLSHRNVNIDAVKGCHCNNPRQQIVF